MALQGLSVVEVAGSPAGGYLAKLLADQGADVVIVERHAVASTTDQALRLALDGAKRHAGVLATEEFAALVSRADVVVESSAPDPLTPLTGPGGLDHDRLISVRLSPFGPRGPYCMWRSTDLTDYAVSGHLLLTGDPDREPLQGPGHQPSYAAGLHGAIATMAALVDRHASGRGQVIDVSHHEVMAALHQFTLLRYTHNGNILRRMGNRYAGPGQPIGLYRCRDGYLSLTVPRDDQLERLLAAAGLLGLLEHPDIATTYDLMHHPTLLDEHLRPWLATQDAEEAIELFQALRVPAGPVRSMAGLLADKQLVERGVWIAAPQDPTVLLPRSPIRIKPIEELQAGEPGQGAASRPLGGLHGPLTGLRVLDLTRVWAGPLATRILADLGADVVMIEAPWARGPAGIDRSSVEATHYYPKDDPGEEHWNRIGFFNKYAINKRSVALDLGQPAGLDILERLVAWADVVIENYSPRVMPQLGLAETRLAQLNPTVTYVTMPGFGRSGPCADWVAYGPIIDGHAGLSVLQGYRDEDARKGGVAWPDPVAGMHAAFAVLLSIAARQRGAQRSAVVVELAQLEATITMVAHALVHYQLTGEEPTPPGNRSKEYAPQGVYRTSGEDRWIALSVTRDASWTGLVEAAQMSPGWLSWDLEQRFEHHDEIDAALAQWARPQDANAAVIKLQAIGVAAAAAADAADVMKDPHLLANDFFVSVDHPRAGRHAWPRFAAHLAGTPATYRRAAPLLGEHNHDIVVGLLGMDPDDFAALSANGVLAERPPD